MGFFYRLFGKNTVPSNTPPQLNEYILQQPLDHAGTNCLTKKKGLDKIPSMFVGLKIVLTFILGIFIVLKCYIFDMALF